MPKINALCTSAFDIALGHCDEIYTTCSVDPEYAGKAVTFSVYEKHITRGNIYIDSLLDDEILENACDYLVSSRARAIVRAEYNLEETGIIEAKYKLSPVMLLHRLGVLEYCTIASGVCLDNDDLDLMAQEDVGLILLPTADAGYGNGFAPVCAAVRRGIRVGIGTYDGKYNPSADIKREAEFLRLAANAKMSRENALSDAELRAILSFEKPNIT